MSNKVESAAYQFKTDAQKAKILTSKIPVPNWSYQQNRLSSELSKLLKGASFDVLDAYSNAASKISKEIEKNEEYQKDKKNKYFVAVVAGRSGKLNLQIRKYTNKDRTKSAKVDNNGTVEIVANYAQLQSEVDVVKGLIKQSFGKISLGKLIKIGGTYYSSLYGSYYNHCKAILEDNTTVVALDCFQAIQKRKNIQNIFERYLISNKYVFDNSLNFEQRDPVNLSNSDQAKVQYWYTALVNPKKVKLSKEQGVVKENGWNGILGELDVVAHNTFIKTTGIGGSLSDKIRTWVYDLTGLY